MCLLLLSTLFVYCGFDCTFTFDRRVCLGQSVTTKLTIWTGIILGFPGREERKLICLEKCYQKHFRSGLWLSKLMYNTIIHCFLFGWITIVELSWNTLCRGSNVVSPNNKWSWVINMYQFPKLRKKHNLEATDRPMSAVQVGKTGKPMPERIEAAQSATRRF